MVDIGFANGRRYVLFGLAQAAAVGVIAWAICYSEDVAAPIVVGVAVAALSVIPGFGILVGGLFGILLEAGLGTADGALRLTVAFVLLQVAHTLFTRRFVVPRSLSVGPAVIVISVIVGFEIYGIGGAIYAAILAIFGIAILDAAGLSGANRTLTAAAPRSPRRRTRLVLAGQGAAGVAAVDVAEERRVDVVAEELLQRRGGGWRRPRAGPRAGGSPAAAATRRRTRRAGRAGARSVVLAPPPCHSVPCRSAPTRPASRRRWSRRPRRSAGAVRRSQRWLPGISRVAPLAAV